MGKARTQFPLSKCFQNKEGPYWSLEGPLRWYWHYNWQIWLNIQKFELWRRRVAASLLFPETIFPSIILSLKWTLIHSHQQRPLGLMFNADRPPVRRFSIFVRFVLVYCFLALVYFFRRRKDGLFCFVGFANTSGEGRIFLILSEETTGVKHTEYHLINVKSK